MSSARALQNTLLNTAYTNMRALYTIAALLSSDLHSSLDFGDVPLAFEVWLSVFSKPVLQGLFPAAPVSLTSNALLFSLPAGFACSRLLLHWKTDRFQGFFALLGFLNPFRGEKIPGNLCALSLHRPRRSLFSLREIGPRLLRERNRLQSSHQVL